MPSRDDEIDLREMAMLLWDGKIKLLFFTLIAALISVGIALYLPSLYESSALLAPKKRDPGGLGQFQSQYGGLASLAGINLGGNVGGAQTATAIETLKSRIFFREYLYEDILVELMAVKLWDSESDDLVIDTSMYDPKLRQWIRDSGSDGKPTVQQAYKAFQGALQISEDQTFGFVSVSVEHLSPHVARRWVETMIRAINEAMREVAIAEARRSIDYLQEQLEGTNLVNLDTVFAQLIEEQTKVLMLAHASPDYVFQIIDPPVASEFRSRPSRSQISILGTLFGGVFGVLFLFFSHYFRDVLIRDNNPNAQ